eukprot:m.1023819 g.1023819  ORF g.1023819 m.1023819 type:complete len:51 (-) comp24098_c0_seq39:556-708(-)
MTPLKVASTLGGTMSHSDIVQGIIGYTQTNADEAFVFGNVRGCGRKKVKL